LDETSREVAGDVGIEVASVFVQGIERIAGPTRLVAEIDANNEPNQRSSRRLGFVLVGEPACKDSRLIDIL
jgi:RimJ/RimL family protein N-acetyltransferase